MKIKAEQSGLTLIEQIVVVAAIAVLTSLSLPAVNSFLNSFESQGSTKAMISATMASARAIAARQQKYAGIRFQNKYQQDGKGEQYAVFVVYDYDATGLENGFRALENIEPVKLAETMGLMEVIDGSNKDAEIDEPKEMNDKTTFSIIFSPSGKLIIHEIRVRNRDGFSNTNNQSKDDIFNTQDNVEDYKAMFYQDYSADGFEQEPSRSSFIIYNKNQLNQTDQNRRWTDYLETLDVIHINPYSGTIINRGNH